MKRTRRFEIVPLAEVLSKTTDVSRSGRNNQLPAKEEPYLEHSRSATHEGLAEMRRVTGLRPRLRKH